LDAGHDAFDILDDLIVPEADNSKALRFEISGSSSVETDAPSVLAAVQFDDEPCSPSNKVGDEPSNRNLPIEPHAQLPVAKHCPQLSFSVIRIVTKRT
jgi:hypothetical protein